MLNFASFSAGIHCSLLASPTQEAYRMAKNLQPSKEEARKLGPVVLYGETQKLLEELGSKRLSAVPSTPLPSLVSVSVHLHAFAMQHRFNLKPVFSARRRTFKCTRFRSRSVKLDEPACEVFFEVIEAQGGWTVGEKMLEHTHRLNKHAKSHIRTRWSNLELGGTNPEDASYGNRASRTRKSTSISSLSNSGEDDSDSSSDSESEYDTAEEAEPAPGISGGFMHRSLAPQSASSQKVSAVTTVDGETAAWKLLQTEESEMRSAALYSETTHLLKSVSLRQTVCLISYVDSTKQRRLDQYVYKHHPHLLHSHSRLSRSTYTPLPFNEDFPLSRSFKYKKGVFSGVVATAITFQMVRMVCPLHAKLSSGLSRMPEFGLSRNSTIDIRTSCWKRTREESK